MHKIFQPCDRTVGLGLSLLVDARPQVVRINYLPLRDRSIILVNIPSSHGDQDGGEGQQEEDCATSGFKSPWSSQPHVDYLGNDDQTSRGESESQVSVDYKDQIKCNNRSCMCNSFVLLTYVPVFHTDDLWEKLPLPHCEANLLVCQSGLC